ncbi:hypothetical protein RU95_GL002955 [Enterococcus avium]|nr:hypothetical protein RU95_GL002955 [Enterococcus avium]
MTAHFSTNNELNPKIENSKLLFFVMNLQRETKIIVFMNIIDYF